MGCSFIPLQLVGLYVLANSDRMDRWFLMAFKVEKTVMLSSGRASRGIITVERLIQAQTEIESIEKFKQTLRKSQSHGVIEKYLSHENKTIL